MSRASVKALTRAGIFDFETTGQVVQVDFLDLRLCAEFLEVLRMRLITRVMLC